MSADPVNETDSMPRPGFGEEDPVVRVLQLTDSHLYSNPDGTLAGLNTLNSFDRVLALAAERTAASDCILATGDLVHDATAKGYAVMAARLQQLDRPVYCLPGNHDVPAVMQANLNQGWVATPKSVRYGNWLIILLDSTLPDEVGGALSPGELENLRLLLDANPDSDVLVSLHHHPVPIGSEWMDDMALANPSDFFGIIDRHERVRGVLWGHIHQIFEDERDGVRLMGSPSTCIQFKPGQDRFEIDRSAPGYRWLDLYPDGQIISGVERIAAIPAGLNIASSGYE